MGIGYVVGLLAYCSGESIRVFCKDRTKRDENFVVNVANFIK